MSAAPAGVAALQHHQAGGGGTAGQRQVEALLRVPLLLLLQLVLLLPVVAVVVPLDVMVQGIGILIRALRAFQLSHRRQRAAGLVRKEARRQGGLGGCAPHAAARALRLQRGRAG